MARAAKVRQLKERKAQGAAPYADSEVVQGPAPYVDSEAAQGHAPYADSEAAATSAALQDANGGKRSAAAALLDPGPTRGDQDTGAMETDSMGSPCRQRSASPKRRKTLLDGRPASPLLVLTGSDGGCSAAEAAGAPPQLRPSLPTDENAGKDDSGAVRECVHCLACDEISRLADRLLYISVLVGLRTGAPGG